MMNLSLASGGDNIKLWDVGSGYSLIKEYNPHAGNISSLCWSNDNACLASASSLGDKIAVTYTNANSAAHSFDIGTEEHRSCIAYNSMSRYVMGGGPDGLVHIWDLKTRKLKKTYKGHKSAVTSVQFNWNDTVIASGSETGQIIIFSVVTGIGFSPLILPKEQAIRQIQYSHFKRTLLATASDDGSINLWDTSGKRHLHAYDKAHKAPAMGLVFSPLNEMLMMSVGLDKKIVCFDVVGKTAVKTMVAESPLTAIDLYQDGATLAVGSTRGKVYIYDLRQGATPVKTIAAHKSSVQSLKFQYGASNASKSDVGGKAKPSSSVINTKQHVNNTPSNLNSLNNNVVSQQLSDIHRSAANFPSNVKSPSNFAGIMEKDEIFSPLSENSNITSRKSAAGTGGDTCSPPLPDSTHRVPVPTDEFTRDQQRLYGFDHISEEIDKMSKVPPYPRSDPELVRSLSNDNGQLSADIPVRDIRLTNQQKTQSSTLEDSLPHSSKSSVTSDYEKYDSSRSVSSNSHQRSHLPDRATPQLSPTQAAAPLHNGDLPSPPKNTSKSSVTAPPGEAAPNYPTAAASSVTKSDNTTPSLQPFHTQFIRNIIEDSLEDFREQIRQDVLNLHMEMLKQFLLQQSEMQKMIKEHSINEELLAEVVRLKEENRLLKKKF